MISGTIYSKEKDQFKNYTFSAREWSAPTMVVPQNIQRRIDSFALCGQRIKRMRLIGLSYFHTRDWAEDTAYRQLEHLPEKERQLKSNYPTIDPDKEGRITPDGKTVIPARYERIGWCRDHKHFFCCSNGCCEMYAVETI